MKHNLKKIIYLSILTLGIISCRQEEIVQESKNEEKTFRLFNKENYKQYKNSQENSSLSRLYALDFLQAYYSYDLKNGTNYTGFNIKGPVPTSYINFRVHSQVIEDKEGNIYMYFPVIKNEKVFDIYFSSINKENTLLGLYKLNNNAEEYKDIFSAFEKVFVHPNEKIFSRSEDVTDVGEVVIVGPSKPTNGTGITGPGQCEMYGQCNNPGGGSGSSGGSGGGGGTPVFSPPPPPELPIKDVKDFLSCLDTSKSASLTVYAQEMFGGNGVGHAFISITQGSNTMVFGFYPKNKFPNNATGSSTFGDDSGHAYTHSWNVGTISSTQLQQIIATALAFSSSIYDVASNNCADFALISLSQAGVNTNTTGLDTPNTVRNLIQSNNGNSTKGNAPQTKKCK